MFYHFPNRSVSLLWKHFSSESNHSENVTVAQLTDVIVRYKIRLFQRTDFVPSHKYIRYKSKQSQLNNTKSLWLWTKEICVGSQDLLSTQVTSLHHWPLNCGKANWCLQALFLKSPPPWNSPWAHGIPDGRKKSQSEWNMFHIHLNTSGDVSQHSFTKIPFSYTISQSRDFIRQKLVKRIQAHIK